MATEQQMAVTQDDLAIGLDAVIGYVDTAVDTLTKEMDRQFKEGRGWSEQKAFRR